MNMNKNRIGLLIGVIAGIIIVFFVGRYLFTQRAADREKQAQVEQENEKLAAATQSLHQVCRYADSVGIDTSRFAVGAQPSLAQLDDKRARLLLEIRYGKKPSRMEFDGLKEAVDSSWAQKADVSSMDGMLASAATFGPYKQLVGHYNRLRKLAGSRPAMADSLRIIRQSLNFYRYTNRFAGDRFVVVNIPAGELNVFDRSGRRLLPMQVIAGKADKRTPCMTTAIQNIVAYPYWNVPKSIATKEMLPKIQRDVAFLYNQNLEVLDERNKVVNPEDVDWASLSETNFPYRIRQASGCENALGLIKFDLINPLAIYLHDTNGRDMFTLTADRWRSHGCVRVQKPVELANFVLGKETFDKGFMNRCLIDQKPQTMAVAKPFPVFIAYNTADVDAAGRLRFYKDVYGFDK